MIFALPNGGIVDEKLPHPGVPVCEDETAGPTIRREVKAVVVVAVRIPIEEVQTLVAELAAGVVVDHIEQHRDAERVADIDQRLELSGLTPQMSPRSPAVRPRPSRRASG